MVFSIVIDCDDIDLEVFEILDVRARIYIVRPNQELGPVEIRLNNNFRIVEDDQVRQDEVSILTFKNFTISMYKNFTI